MRPREREEDAATPEPAPPSPPAADAVAPAPPSRAGGGLSSMVVRPSDSGGGGDGGACGSDFEAGEGNHHRRRRRDSTPPPRRRNSPAVPPRRHSPPPPFRRRGSPPAYPRRGSPPAYPRRGSPPPYTRRYSPPPAFHRRASPPGFQPRSQRFNGIPGNGARGGSISPPRRQRMDDSRYGPDLDHPVGPRPRRGLPGRGAGGRFQDVSPHHGLGRGGRAAGRGNNVPRRGSSPLEGEYVHRNDPNLSPREGDWICQNPSCGNLNFARRSYCNNCDQFRYGHEGNGFSRSPRRGYANSPPLYESPPRVPGPAIDRGRRELSGYRSPRRMVVGDPREFETGSPLAVRAGRFPHIRRERPDYRDDDFLERGKRDWPVHDEWDRRDRRRDDSFLDRRVYDERPRASPPHDRVILDSRDRSRSPLVGRPLKGSYAGRGRDDRRFREPYIGSGQDDLDDGRGRGSWRAKDNSFIGRGRGDRPGMGRGRNGGNNY